MKKKVFSVFGNLSLLLATFCAPAVVWAQAALHTLSLEEAMGLAEDYLPSARIAAQTYEMSAGKVSEAARSILPTVALSGSYYQYGTQYNKAVGTPSAASFGLPTDLVSSSVGATLTQHVSGLVPLVVAIQEASAKAQADLHAKNYSKSEARFLGASAYINAIKAQQLLGVAASFVEVAKTQLHDGEALFHAGTLTNADLLKFKLNLETAKTNFLQAQTTYKVALVVLASTVGIQDPFALVLPEHYVPAFEKRPPMSFAQATITQQALQNRLDLQASEALVTYARYGVYRAASSYAPNIDFVANYSRNLQARDSTSALTGVVFKKEDIQDTTYYGVVASWTLLDWGVRQAQIGEAVAAKSLAMAQHDQLEWQVKQDAVRNLLNFQDAYQNLDSAKVSVAYARDVYVQMELQFKNGRATTTDVLSASDGQTAALAQLANAIGDLDLAGLSLQKTVGSPISTVAQPLL